MTIQLSSAPQHSPSFQQNTSSKITQQALLIFPVLSRQILSFWNLSYINTATDQSLFFSQSKQMSDNKHLGDISSHLPNTRITNTQLRQHTVASLGTRKAHRVKLARLREEEEECSKTRIQSSSSGQRPFSCPHGAGPGAA